MELKLSKTRITAIVEGKVVFWIKTAPTAEETSLRLNVKFKELGVPWRAQISNDGAAHLKREPQK